MLMTGRCIPKVSGKNPPKGFKLKAKRDEGTKIFKLSREQLLSSFYILEKFAS